MQRNKLSVIRDFIVKHCKYIFPVLVVAIVAFTAAFAFNMNQKEKNDKELAAGTGSISDSNIVLWFEAFHNSEEEGSATAEPVVDAVADATEDNLWFYSAQENILYYDITNITDISADDFSAEDIPEFEMQPNENGAIYTLIKTYYNAQAEGDIETLKSICDTISENDLAYYQALSEYMDHYTEIQVSTKRGLVNGSAVAYIYYRVCFINHEEEFPGSYMLYICTNEQGELYIKNEDNFTEAEVKYIETVSSQADVKEFKNRVDVEYNDFIRDNPTMLVYLEEVINQASINHGVALAEMNQSGGQPETEGNGGEGQDDPNSGSTPEASTPETPSTPEYATATTTVNVRGSDSEKADKLGRVTTGTRVKVKEVGVNGWTKVEYQGADGYIKSEYLQFAESAAGQDVIGTVTANTNVNIRAAASQTAEKLGMLTGGESLDLLAVEGDWCKVVFNGQVAYVKAEFVQQH